MFTLRSYNRKELALLYFPSGTSSAAYQCLRRWLNEYKDSHPQLLERIKGRRIIRKPDVAEIVALLGEP